MVLGKWQHACDTKTSEDTLTNPSAVPFSDDVDFALKGAKDLLLRILESPAQADPSVVPAITWLQQQKKSLNALVPHSGSLTAYKQAQIANWFESNITKDHTIRHKWIGSLANVHAQTLYIASILKSRDDLHGSSEANLLQKAWNEQVNNAAPHWDHIDVDAECLCRLEEEMFEVSLRAGISGHYQWGLDAGDHQGKWDPYCRLPEQWNHGDRDGNDAELVVSLLHKFWLQFTI
ncbi:hypothetical protein C0992_004637 [Termitomyces sp. T32_za158]|nr:hypothetical protein C0992_004637 [Termitomyces sp. T32_za158]